MSTTGCNQFENATKLGCNRFDNAIQLRMLQSECRNCWLKNAINRESNSGTQRNQDATDSILQQNQQHSDATCLVQQLFIPKIIWIKNRFQTIFFRKYIKTVINHFSNIFYCFLLFCCSDIFCPPMWCVMLFVLMCIHLQTRLFRQVHVGSQGSANHYDLH